MITVTLPIVHTAAWQVVTGFFVGWALFLAFRLGISLITG